MRRLLIADLHCSLNLLRQRDGRRLFLSAAVSLVFLWMIADLFGRVLVSSPEFAVTGSGVEPISGLLGSVLLPALLMSIWFGFSGGPRQLFELPQLDLLLQSPTPAPLILASTWLRFGTIVSLWCTALCGPIAMRIGDQLQIELGLATTALACTALVMPAIAVLLGVQIALQRWFAGRVTRFVLTTASTLGSIGFSLLLILGALAQQDAVRSVFAIARGQALWPMLLQSPARLWAEVAIGEPTFATLAAVVGLHIVAAGSIVVFGLLYRRAYENARGSIEPLVRLGRRRAWPSGPVGVIFRKEVQQLAHQPTQLIGILFSAVVVVVLAGGRIIDGTFPDEPRISSGERGVFVMLVLWLFAQLTIAPGCLLRLVALEGAQWPLFVAAPLRSRSFLAGKLLSTMILQAWPALIAAIVGVVHFDASPGTILAFVAVAPAAVLWATAATAFVGTIPPLMRPRGDRNNLLTLIAVALLLILLQSTLLPGLLAWQMLLSRSSGEGPLAGFGQGGANVLLIGAAWAFALIAGGILLALAGLHLRRLRAPER